MKTKYFAKFSKVGIPESSIIDYDDGFIFTPTNDEMEVSLLFGENEIRSLFPDRQETDLIEWFYTNHGLYLRNDGYVCYIQAFENGVYTLSDPIFYSGLTIINDIVVTENTPAPANKIAAIKEIIDEYILKQKACFINGVEFYLSLKGDDYEQFKSSLTTSAVALGRAIVIIKSITDIQYKCPDLPFEILKIIFNLVDPYSKNNFDKKGVIIKLIMNATTDQELQTALARKSEFESPATVNINNICDTLLNDNTTPQSTIDWLNEKKEVINNQNVYHIFTQSN